MRFTRPEIGSAVRVAGRRAVVLAAWDGRGGPRNVLVEFVGSLLPEKWVVHITRIRYDEELGQGANRSALAQRSPDASLDNRRGVTPRSEFAAGPTPCNFGREPQAEKRVSGTRGSVSSTATAKSRSRS